MKDLKWNELRGDGDTQACDAGRLTKFKEELQATAKDAGGGTNDRRALADDVRFCRWPGQSPDGLKHPVDGKAAFPFNGAADTRVRTADQITNEQVIIIMAALMKLNVDFVGIPGPTGAANDRLADKLGVEWEFIKRNQLGAELLVELTKFVQWRQGDSPALAFMQVSWHQESALKVVTTAADEVIQKAVALATAQGHEVAPEDLLQLQDLLVNPARQAELAALLGAVWPDLRDDTAKNVAAELQANGEADFAYPYICENRLKLKARRLFDDMIVPENTPTDLRGARMLFVREWHNEAQLRERDAKGDFKPGFVDKVLEHEGESGWAVWTRWGQDGTWLDAPVQREWNKEMQRGLYEIITVFYRGFNSHGIPGIYSVDFHANVDFAGTDQVLLDYRLNGRYPFVCSTREILTHNLWDSRGNSELAATEQHALKFLHDSFRDNVQLSTVPPMEIPASRPKIAIVWGPLAEIRVNRQGEIKPFAPFPYPMGNEKMMAIVKEGLERYFGQFSNTSPADLVRAYHQSLIDFMLIPVVEIIEMGLRLFNQFMPPEQLQQIGGEADASEAHFKVEASFDAGMLSFDYIKMMGEIISQYILTWDTGQTVPRAELVKWFMSMIAPRMAQKLTRPQEEADQSEIEDEQYNFTLIASGIEPPMMEEGQNWALRRETLLEIGRRNPQAFGALTPNSKLILEARLKHFDGMIEQQKNAVIGRTMAAPALPATANAAA